MSAYHNFLREEGTKEEVLKELFKQLDLNAELHQRLTKFSTLGLDLEQGPTFFDAENPDSACGDLNDLAYGLSLGDEINVIRGYYTPATTYIYVPTVDSDGLCSKCKSKDGCGDWGGEKCPSTHHALISVSEYRGATTDDVR